MGTRIKTRLRIAAHPFFNFFYNTIHLPHTTPRLALDADESVCCVRPLCLTLSSFASLRVWAMLNLFLLFFHFTPPSTFLVRSVPSVLKHIHPILRRHRQITRESRTSSSLPTATNPPLSTNKSGARHGQAVQNPATFGYTHMCFGESHQRKA